jgi:hypothetical protein
MGGSRVSMPDPGGSSALGRGLRRHDPKRPRAGGVQAPTVRGSDPLDARDIVALQRTAGNAAVATLFGRAAHRPRRPGGPSRTIRGAR